MKKNKLKLKDLNVKSFTTEASDKVRGGFVSFVISCEPTVNCPTDEVTKLDGNDVGICEAPSRLCPTGNRC